MALVQSFSKPSASLSANSLSLTRREANRPSGIKGKNNNVVINDMEGVAEFTGISDTSYMFQVTPVLAQKSDQLRSRLIREAEYYSLI